MNILFVTNGYPTKINPEFCIFTKEQINSVLKLDEVNGELFFINAKEKGFFEYLKSIPNLRKKIKNFDIIHAFHGITFLLVFMLYPSKKIVVSFLNNINNEYSEKKAVAKVLVLFTKLFIKKRNVTKIFKDKIPLEFIERSYYLPNGVDTTMFYPMAMTEAKNYLGLDAEKRYILFVSSKNKYRKQKRFDRFKKVIKLLQQKFDNIEELILVNEPRDRIIYYFNAAELHLLTSDFEGSPNSVKESVACNTPVVSTNVGNVKQLIGNIKNCYISHSLDEIELAKMCGKILSLPSREYQISQYIQLKKLDMNSKAKELSEIYKNIYNN